MDGLLILALIVWVIAKMGKSNKKSRAGARRAGENAAQRRAQRVARMNAELEKRREQLVQKAKQQAAEKPVLSEGESSPIYETAENAFRGSMQAESAEGECLCEPELEHRREAEPDPDSVYAGEIGREPLLDFSARGILQGVVMSEILTRPVQRTRQR